MLGLFKVKVCFFYQGCFPGSFPKILRKLLSRTFVEIYSYQMWLYRKIFNHKALLKNAEEAFDNFFNKATLLYSESRVQSWKNEYGRAFIFCYQIILLWNHCVVKSERGNHWRCSLRKGVLRNFTEFTGL